LDPALLRPGRFDKLLYLGIKNDKESRTKILRALCKSDEFDEIVDEIPQNMTGADFYGLVSQATIYATKRTI
jgi:peroxin-6